MGFSLRVRNALVHLTDFQRDWISLVVDAQNVILSIRLSAHTFYDPDRAADSNCLCAGNLADNLKILDHFQYYSIILLYRQISALPSYTRAVEK